MKLEIRLFANLRDKLPKQSKGVAWIDLDTGSTVSDLISYLDLPRDWPLIVMINGKRQPEDTTLKDGDRVGIFPPVGGG